MARLNKWGMGGGYVGADIASALRTKEAMAGALGALDTSRLMKNALDSMQIGKAFTPVDTKGIAAALKSSDVMADSLKALDAQSLMKDALDSMKIANKFDPADTQGMFSALRTKEAMAGALGALDTSRLMKNALDSMQIGKAFTPVDTKGIAAALKSSDVMADSLKALDTQSLMKDALDSMQIGKAFNPVRVKSLAEMLGTEMAGLGALGGRKDFEGIFESESDGDLEASFVRALIGGWFLQLPWGVRVGLVLAALDLLLVSGDWLEAAGAVDPPEPALRVISTAVALVGFVLALASARNSSS